MHDGLTPSQHQKKTNFSAFMDMDKQKHCLRITRFAMAEDTSNLKEQGMPELKGNVIIFPKFVCQR